MKQFEKLNVVELRCTLPTVFGNEITYYEQLCKLQDGINQFVDYMNNLDLDVEAIVDEKIAPIYNYINEEIERVNKRIGDNYVQLVNQINTNYTILDNKINSVDNKYDKQIIDIYTDLQEAFNYLKEYIDNVIIGQINVLNPLNHKYENINKVLDDFYDTFRYYGITCYEFDGSYITCSEFDNLGMTCDEFAMYSKEYLYKSYNDYIFNPINGNYDTLQRVLYTFFQYVRENAISVIEFQNKQHACSTLDGVEYTALIFDENAKNILNNLN